jgi:hypothetical protein
VLGKNGNAPSYKGPAVTRQARTLATRDGARVQLLLTCAALLPTTASARAARGAPPCGAHPYEDGDERKRPAVPRLSRCLANSVFNACTSNARWLCKIHQSSGSQQQPGAHSIFLRSMMFCLSATRHSRSSRPSVLGSCSKDISTAAACILNTRTRLEPPKKVAAKGLRATLVSHNRSSHKAALRVRLSNHVCR